MSTCTVCLEEFELTLSQRQSLGHQSCIDSAEVEEVTEMIGADSPPHRILSLATWVEEYKDEAIRDAGYGKDEDEE